MYRLVGTEVSMYTGKVRPYLRYKRIPFVEVLSTAQVYRTIIIPKTGVSYIPVLLTPDGETAVQDTTEIIDFLERRFPADPIYPATPCQRLVSLLFEVYADEWLVIPAMYYRWSFAENLDFIYREFGRTNVPNASTQDQYEQGKKVATKFASSLPFLGISDETKAGAWFEEFLAHLDRHFAQHAFLLGGKPTMGDFALMGPLYAHISQDPYPGKLLRAKAPHVMQWIERMHFKNEPSAECTAEYLADDAVPSTLFPILQHMFDEHLPVLLDTLARLAAFRHRSVSSSGESDQVAGGIPRSLGWHDFTIGGAKGRRLVYPYAVWMLQRPLDHYRSLTREEQRRIDARVLSRLQGGTDKWADALRATSGACRVARVNNRLVWDSPQPKPQQHQKQQATPAKL